MPSLKTRMSYYEQQIAPAQVAAQTAVVQEQVDTAQGTLTTVQAAVAQAQIDIADIRAQLP